MNISVIIPNYNGQDLLRKNLPKVFEAIDVYKDGKKEIIVTDDHSIDNSINVLQELKPEMESAYPDIIFKVIQNNKNLGFSSNIDRGVGNAEGDILILLNTDVIPQKDFLELLLRHFSDPNIFAVGCMDESKEEGKTILRGRGIGSWKRGFFVHSRGEVDRKNTLWVNGGSGAFRKSIWGKLGGFNKLYNPFYWEDIDLSYNALKSGYKLIFEPKSIVAHEHEKGVIKLRYSSFYIKTTAYRNQFIFVWKNITDFDLQISHIIWFPYHFLKSLIRTDWAFFVGFLRAFVVLPKIIQSSFISQNYYSRRDKDVLGEFTE
ncbi:MAG: glycosyltransferase family 2 protein [Candidatus Levybacteria bacterium]|nr:glycosyltransferase family 2 protein [Candidatus Levybacteria bacterium]